MIDYDEHMALACFTHPGWECEDMSKKREEEAKAKGMTLPTRIPVNTEVGASSQEMAQMNQRADTNVEAMVKATTRDYYLDSDECKRDVEFDREFEAELRGFPAELAAQQMIVQDPDQAVQPPAEGAPAADAAENSEK